SPMPRASANVTSASSLTTSCSSLLLTRGFQQSNPNTKHQTLNTSSRLTSCTLRDFLTLRGAKPRENRRLRAIMAFSGLPMSAPQTRTMPISRGKLQTLGSGSRAMCNYQVNPMLSKKKKYLLGGVTGGGGPVSCGGGGTEFRSSPKL